MLQVYIIHKLAEPVTLVLLTSALLFFAYAVLPKGKCIPLYFYLFIGLL